MGKGSDIATAVHGRRDRCRYFVAFHGDVVRTHERRRAADAGVPGNVVGTRNQHEGGGKTGRGIGVAVHGIIAALVGRRELVARGQVREAHEVRAGRNVRERIGASSRRGRRRHHVGGRVVKRHRHVRHAPFVGILDAVAVDVFPHEVAQRGEADRIHRGVALRRCFGVGGHAGPVGNRRHSGQIGRGLDLEHGGKFFARQQRLIAMQGGRRGAREGIGDAHRRSGGVLDLDPIDAEEFGGGLVAAHDAKAQAGVRAGEGLDVVDVGRRPRTGEAGEVGQHGIRGAVIGGNVQGHGINDFQVVAGFVAVGQHRGIDVGQIGGPVDGGLDRIGIGDAQPAVRDLDGTGGRRRGAIAYLGPVPEPTRGSCI